MDTFIPLGFAAFALAVAAFGYWVSQYASNDEPADGGISVPSDVFDAFSD